MRAFLPDKVPGVGYTLKHRTCVELLIRHYCEGAVGKKDGEGELFTSEDCELMLKRAKCHDVDKLMSYLCYPQFSADYYHRLFQGHHAESLIPPEMKSKYDWIEMIFDWESNRYTKADKTYSAWKFANRVVPQLLPYTERYFELFGLKSEDGECIEEIKKAADRPFTREELLATFREYLETTNMDRLDGVSREETEEFMLWPRGTEHRRPGKYVDENPKYLDIELFDGIFKSGVFDMDRLLKLSEEEIEGVNDAAVERLERKRIEYMSRLKAK